MSQVKAQIEDDYGCKATLTITITGDESIITKYQEEYINLKASKGQKTDIGDFKRFLSEQDEVRLVDLTIL